MTGRVGSSTPICGPVYQTSPFHTAQVSYSRNWEPGLSIQPSNLVPFSDGPQGKQDGVNGGSMRNRPSGMGGAPRPRESAD